MRLADSLLSTATDLLRRRPQAAFAAFLAWHFCLWTALPAALYPNLPLDLIEALTYGREWQLGYDKLPPLPWWLVEIVYRLIGRDAAYYALAQLAVVLAFALVWVLARRLVGPLGALISVLIVDGLHYFNYTAAKFNHDVVQLPLWAAAGYAYWRALREGGLRYWTALGAAVGAALWAKYFVVVLALPLALFVLLEPTARRSLRTPGPYLAAGVALAVMAPHLVWLVQNDFLPFAYASARAAPARGFIDHLLHPVEFVYLQAGFLLPALLIAAPLLLPPRSPAPVSADAAFDRRVVTLLSFGPAATLVALAALSGRGTVSMWGYPLWLFLGLWLVLTWPDTLAGRRAAWAALLWALIGAGYTLAFVVNYAVLPHFDRRDRAVLFPGAAVGTELSARFHAATGGRAMSYVVGSMWTGGNVGHYAPERPRVLIDANPARAPWIDLADLRARGGVIVWSSADTQAFLWSVLQFSPAAQWQPPFMLPTHHGDRIVNVYWAILPPPP
jgi:4-amino-4-deoxy-L-arabinose transferase-like glycosyltransferase